MNIRDVYKRINMPRVVVHSEVNVGDYIAVMKDDIIVSADLEVKCIPKIAILLIIPQKRSYELIFSRHLSAITIWDQNKSLYYIQHDNLEIDIFGKCTNKNILYKFSKDDIISPVNLDIIFKQKFPEYFI